jgi:hypothetical protein
VRFQNTLPIGGSSLSGTAKVAGYALLVVLGFGLWVPAFWHRTFREGAQTARVPPATDAINSKHSDPNPIAGKRIVGSGLARPERPTVISFATAHRDGSGKHGAGEIHLTATILGKTRRGAVLNGRLYREGDRVINRGEQYQLTSVLDDRVELSPIRPSGHRRSLTVLPHPKLVRTLGEQSAFTPPL